MAEYHQGKFVPRNPSKYIGNVNDICYRSGWERKFMIWCDTTPSVLSWGSEEVVIPYISPVDNRPHRYFVDFIIKYKTSTGEIKKALVEIKPKAQTMLPKQRKRTQRYLEEVKTYAVNQAKWKYADEWAKDRGIEFRILTEKELGI